MSRGVWLVLTVAVFAIPIGPLLLALGMLHYRFYRILGPTEHHLLRIVFVWLLCIAIVSYVMFRRLLSKYSRREARAIASIFGITFPFALVLGVSATPITFGQALSTAIIVSITTLIEALLAVLTLKIVGSFGQPT